MDFSKILNRGRRKFKSKDTGGVWNECEYCERRRLLFKYEDNKNEMWNLCDECIDLFIKEEE